MARLVSFTVPDQITRLWKSESPKVNSLRLKKSKHRNLLLTPSSTKKPGEEEKNAYLLHPFPPTGSRIPKETGKGQGRPDAILRGRIPDGERLVPGTVVVWQGRGHDAVGEVVQADRGEDVGQPIRMGMDGRVGEFDIFFSPFIGFFFFVNWMEFEEGGGGELVKIKKGRERERERGVEDPLTQTP